MSVNRGAHPPIPNLAFDDANQLPLRTDDLIVDAAQYAARRPRMRVLHEGQVEAGRGKVPHVPGFEEEAAIVLEAVDVDDADAG